MGGPQREYECAGRRLIGPPSVLLAGALYLLLAQAVWLSVTAG